MKTIVYVPQGAKLNVENQPMEAPTVEKYENRKVTFDLNMVKRIVGGKYGRMAQLKRPNS